MAHQYQSLRSGRNASYKASTPSPLRHASYASNSSADSAPSYPEPGNENQNSSPQLTPDFRHVLASPHKRRIGDTSPTRSTAVPDYHYARDQGTSPPSMRAERQSLRPIPQASNIQPTPPSKGSGRARYADSTHEAQGQQSGFDSNGTVQSPRGLRNMEASYTQLNSVGVSRSDSRRTKQAPHATATPQNHILESSELEQLGKSSTGHLRTLSKFAEDNDHVDFKITSPEQEVAGLSGRKKLQRNMSTRAKRNAVAPGYGGRTWMDTQRQFLQAYEYLCHIGEAKEWIEDVIKCSIPPIVQLEESLRDGVVLAELVQALKPEKSLRIFRNPKLQFRHSDNIAIFFRYLSEVDLPELFRFELVDLYEKKNIPKVIYCIHALSWILLRKGIVDFRIGNLIGQLEFDHDELEAMQKGLDRSGISMPNFSGMRENFGAEPEPPPEPKETEEERINRELQENESAVQDLQGQIKGALTRLRLGDTMQHLWDHEDLFIELQSRVRGDFARQIFGYRLRMKLFAVELQKFARGYLVRKDQSDRQTFFNDQQQELVSLQSVFRARKARKSAQHLRTELGQHQHGFRTVQAAVRGYLERKAHIAKIKETCAAQASVSQLQALCHGMLVRARMQKNTTALASAQTSISQFQAAVRGSQTRSVNRHVVDQLSSNSSSWRDLQAHYRAQQVRQAMKAQHSRLESHSASVIHMQALCRASQQRIAATRLQTELAHHVDATLRLQSAIRGFSMRRKGALDKQALQRHAPALKSLQSLIRAFNVRTSIFELLRDAYEHESSLVVLQSYLRGHALRGNVGDDIGDLEAEETTVVDLQSCCRGVIVRQRFAEKQKHFRENMQKVIKIQSFVRGRQQGEAYKSLTSGENPPVSTVKNFVHLLNDSDFDFEEEVELEKLRKTVGTRARELEQTEQWIAELDAKIGLLAQNKIARDEIAKVQKHYGANVHAARSLTSRETFNLKALNKTSRAKFELYQQLFFQLQTQTIYLARLFKKVRESGATEEDYKRLEKLIINVFGYAQKNREQFYFLDLLASAIREEANGCATLEDFQRGSYFFSRLFNVYTRERAPQDRKYMREVIGSFIRVNVLEDSGLDLETDPLQIYRAVINNEELRTGQRIGKPLDIPREEAIKDQDTRNVFVKHLQDLRDITDAYLTLLDDSISKVPYAPRIVARRMFETLCERFHDADPAYILQQVGNWIWKTYLRPPMTDPEKLGVIDRGLDAQQRRNMSDLINVLNYVVAGKLFGRDETFLQPLNSYMQEAIQRAQDIWERFIDVPDAETHFDIDTLGDIHAKNPPTLHLKMSDIFAVHQMIASNIISLCPDHNDSELREVMRELGSAKSNEMELGASSSEVTLSLSARIHDKHDPDEDVKALFMETKRCILYIIRVQAGANLKEIMLKPITEDDEARWEALVLEEISETQRNANGSRARARAYTAGSTSTTSNTNPNSNLADLAAMSYPELKSIALENIMALEQRGRLTRTNGYQDILNDIALDIRQKHKRRLQRSREADNVRATLSALEEKRVHLDDKFKAYNDTFEQNLNVLQNKKAKKRLLMPFSTQWNHERELSRLGRTPQYGSFKYTAEDLSKKGILIEWRGQWPDKDTEVTISSDEVNVFLIEGSSGSLMIPGASATFTWDDLLEAQYAGHKQLKYFGGEKGTGQLIVDAERFMQQVSKKFWPEG